jgi:mannose-6-phosphate isomerase-like protein (cupin superfamily)
MKSLLLFLLAAGFASTAGDPPAFHLWKAAELQAFPRTLAPKLNASQMVSQPLAAEHNYSFLALLRKTTGEVEVHETKADIFVIESGEATLIVGGTVEHARTTQPNEIRGASIVGGVEKKIAAGDVLTIPPKMPHQVKVEPGKEVAYLAIKVAQ